MKSRSAAGLALAAVITVAVVAAVLRFGVIPTPAFPSLAAHPDPAVTGTVAFLRGAGGGDRTCVALVPAGGGPVRERSCGDDSYRPFGFDSSGNLVVDEAAGSPGTRPAEGRPVVIDTDGCWDDEPGLSLVARGRGGAADRVLFEGRAPRDYCFGEVTTSPDGRWFVTVDSDGRVLVGAPDRPGLRLLAGGARSYSAPVWFQPGRAPGSSL